jgi:DNA-directed RNA polymerase specialized sigma24 family protein
MSESSSSPSPLFPQTRWTLLQQLREGSTVESKNAMEKLCRAYWYPLYAVARRKGMSEEDAQDATQGFFMQLLRRESLHSADQSRGKLRTLLLASFDNFMKEQWRAAQRQKRAGSAEHVPWVDLEEAESRYLQTAELCSSDIETFYNREWARFVLERSMAALRASYIEKGQADRFDVLAVFLTQADPAEEMSAAAIRLGISYETFRVALHRIRQQYRDKIEQELALTLDTDDPGDIKQELRELFKAFE